MRPASWQDLLACPTCRHPLDADTPRCAVCDTAWPRAEGALDLVPRGLDALGGAPGDRWREALRGLDAWRARQRPSPSIPGGVDPRTARLLDDAALRGAVVDVGGKDGAKRHAMPEAVTAYLSVDPCARATPPTDRERPGLSWAAVRGVAEALPVRDGAADAVFSTAAMDYFVDTARGVAEFARALRPGGTLALLVTVHPAPVAHAREGETRGARAVRALRPGVVRAVGLRASLSLAWDGARASAREHTRYLTEPEVTEALAGHFSVRSLARDVGRYSTTLRIVATRRA
jgi:SAM-dependent methyltransferase